MHVCTFIISFGTHRCTTRGLLITYAYSPLNSSNSSTYLCPGPCAMVVDQTKRSHTNTNAHTWRRDANPQITQTNLFIFVIGQIPATSGGFLTANKYRIMCVYLVYVCVYTHLPPSAPRVCGPIKRRVCACTTCVHLDRVDCHPLDTHTHTHTELCR